jgi:RNA polymerase sigma factor (sigma-70 family)
MGVPPKFELSPLAADASRGSRAAMEDLLRHLRPEIVRVTRLVLGPGPSYAEDAAQEALLDVSRGIGNLHDPAAVRTWALRVAMRRALKVARWERLRSFHGVDAVLEPAVEQPPDALAELKEYFYRLPPRMRAVAVLRLYAGLSEIETSVVLGCSKGTVKSQLHEARVRLAALIKEER